MASFKTFNEWRYGKTTDDLAIKAAETCRCDDEDFGFCLPCRAKSCLDAVAWSIND
jgi:hypothetical protein